MQQLFSFLVPSPRLVGIFLLTILLPVSPALAMSILNGSFEQGTISDLDPRFETLPAGSENITSWEIIGDSVDYIDFLWMASDGDRSLDLSGLAAGGVQQTFATVDGQMYEVVRPRSELHPAVVSRVKVISRNRRVHSPVSMESSWAGSGPRSFCSILISSKMNGTKATTNTNGLISFRMLQSCR